MAEKLKLTFALLSDVGNRVARQFGLVFTHQQVGADLPTFNGDDAWELPMAGTVRLAFVDPDFTRRLDPSVIITRLNELKDER